MALTRLENTGDGVTTIYDVSFNLGYLREEFVFVYLATDTFATQLSYTFINSTQIELDTPVASGVLFYIRRIVDRNEPVNDYEEGAILRESNLDASFVQSLMILEEIQDGWLQAEGTVLFRSDIDMLGNTLTGLKNAANTTDAIPYAQLLNLLVDNDVQSVLPVVHGRQVADGVGTQYTAPHTTITTEFAFFVNIDGISQRPNTDFTTSSIGLIDFDEAPPLNADIDITLFEPRTSLGTIVTTSTELNSTASAINSDGRKAEGLLVFNSDTKITVVANSALASDVWLNTLGATTHTPS